MLLIMVVCGCVYCFLLHILMIKCLLLSLLLFTYNCYLLQHRSSNKTFEGNVSYTLVSFDSFIIFIGTNIVILYITSIVCFKALIMFF
jgi:hypothetical protein